MYATFDIHIEPLTTHDFADENYSDLQIIVNFIVKHKLNLKI